jgi:hypothetical protein
MDGFISKKPRDGASDQRRHKAKRSSLSGRKHAPASVRTGQHDKPVAVGSRNSKVAVIPSTASANRLANVENNFGNQFFAHYRLTKPEIANCARLSALFAASRRIRLAHASAKI